MLKRRAKIISDMPCKVVVIPHIWIPLSDGTRLAAKVWYPSTVSANPVPAILEYNPFGKSHFTAITDSMNHGYFAGHGYASVRVDVRGTGDSEGIVNDESNEKEIADALDVIEWLCAQFWCSGSVGMMGLGWAGFNSLVVAACRPKALKAVISVSATNDTSEEGDYYQGGCLVGSHLLPCASTMLACNAKPPDPNVVGKDWLQMWLNRLEKNSKFGKNWFQVQSKDESWQHRDIRLQFDDIQCPVYAVGGWADPSRNSVLRIVEQLKAPCKGLIGPWGHQYPHLAVPGPRIGFLQECLRWWDYWLKGVDNEIMKEPKLRLWVQDSVEPENYYEMRPGKWVAENQWPADHYHRSHYYFHGKHLVKKVKNPIHRKIEMKQTMGMAAGVWCPMGLKTEWPTDQNQEDELALSFTSEPLTQPMTILGRPEVRLNIAADQPLAAVVVRLCDVSPEGDSTLLTWGMLNLSQRDRHDQPKKVKLNKLENVALWLNAIAHTLPKGHSWRLAISPAYWPHVWPGPEQVTLMIFTDQNSCLFLPVRDPDPDLDSILVPFLESEVAPPISYQYERYPHRKHALSITAQKDFRVYDRQDNGFVYFPDDKISMQSISTDYSNISRYSPQSAQVRCERKIELLHDEKWHVKLETMSEMHSDDEYFYMSINMRAFNNGRCIFDKIWHHSYKRDLR